MGGKFYVQYLLQESRPAIGALGGAIGALSLADFSILLGLLSGLFGIIYTLSALYWGWVKYFRHRPVAKNKAGTTAED